MSRPITVLDAFRLGDLVYTAALIGGIRSAWPGREVRVVTSAVGARLPCWESLGVVPFPADFPWLGKQGSPASWWRLWHSCRRLRSTTAGSEGWDVRGDPRQRMVLRLLGCAPIRSVSYNRRSRYWWKGEHLEHLAETRQRFLREQFPDSSLALKWPFLERGPTPVSRPTLVLAPEASNRLRCLPESLVGEVSREASRRGWRTVRITERTPANGQGCAPSGPGEEPELWSGTLPALFERIRTADAVVAVDSFVGHLAAAHGLPVVSLFGPALASYVRPWGDSVRVLDPEGDFPCRPCRQTRCVHADASPNGSACMAAFTASRIVDACTQSGRGV